MIKSMSTAALSNLSIVIDGMSCGHCVDRITKSLGTVPGVEVMSVVVGSARVAVPDTATASAALAAIQGAGFAARIAEAASDSTKSGGCCGGDGRGPSCCA